MLRVQIIKLAEEEHLLIFSVHHIVCDGWSTGVLLDEISIVYSAICQGSRTSFLNPQRIRDCAGIKAGVLKSLRLQYWVDQFAYPPPVLELPTDRPRPPFKSYKGGTVKWTLTLSLSVHKRVAVEQRTTLFAMLFAAYNLLLSRLSGQSDIVVGIPAAGQAIAASPNSSDITLIYCRYVHDVIEMPASKISLTYQDSDSRCFRSSLYLWHSPAP